MHDDPLKPQPALGPDDEPLAELLASLSPEERAWLETEILPRIVREVGEDDATPDHVLRVAAESVCEGLGLASPYRRKDGR